VGVTILGGYDRRDNDRPLCHPSAVCSHPAYCGMGLRTTGSRNGATGEVVDVNRNRAAAGLGARTRNLAAAPIKRKEMRAFLILAFGVRSIVAVVAGYGAPSPIWAEDRAAIPIAALPQRPDRHRRYGRYSHRSASSLHPLSPAPCFPHPACEYLAAPSCFKSKHRTNAPGAVNGPRLLRLCSVPEYASRCSRDDRGTGADRR
jgi:hypothetical protein